MKENLKRKAFDWQPGMEVLVQDNDGEKLSAKAKGPYTITKVHTNGTVTIRLKPNVYQRLNIRRIKPYHRRYGN